MLINVIAVTLPGGPRSASAARRLLAAVLADAGCPRELIDRVVLVGSELVTNAVLHGQGPPRLRLVPLGPGIRLEVYDGSNRQPRQLVPSPGDLHGRGLQIVSECSDRWGVRRNGEGKCVWADFGAVPPQAKGAASSTAATPPASASGAAAASSAVISPRPRPVKRRPARRTRPLQPRARWWPGRTDASRPQPASGTRRPAG